MLEGNGVIQRNQSLTVAVYIANLYEVSQQTCIRQARKIISNRAVLRDILRNTEHILPHLGMSYTYA